MVFCMQNSPPRARPPHDDAQFPPPRANISAAIAAPLLPAPASPPSASHHHQQHPGQQPTPAIVQVGQPSSYHSLSPGRPRYVGPPISSTATDFASGGGGSSAAAPVHADWAGEAAVSASRATSAPAPTRPSVGAGGMAQHHPFARRHLPPASSSSSHLRPPLAPPAAARMPSHPSTSHLHPGMRTHSSSGAGTMGAAWAAAGTSDAPPNARGKGAEGGRGEEIGELAAALFDASSVFGEVSTLPPAPDTAADSYSCCCCLHHHYYVHPSCICIWLLAHNAHLMLVPLCVLMNGRTMRSRCTGQARWRRAARLGARS